MNDSLDNLFAGDTGVGLMWYILKNTDTGRYVAPPGRSHSYTSSLRSARKFRDIGSATANACGNEVALPLEDEINRQGETQWS